MDWSVHPSRRDRRATSEAGAQPTKPGGPTCVEVNQLHVARFESGCETPSSTNVEVVPHREGTAFDTELSGACLTGRAWRTEKDAVCSPGCQAAEKKEDLRFPSPEARLRVDVGDSHGGALAGAIGTAKACGTGLGNQSVGPSRS